MAQFLDYHTVRLCCARCGHATSKTIGWLKDNAEYECEACGHTNALEIDDFASDIRRAEQAVSALGF